MKVARIEEDTLSEEERQTVDRIGIENLDYCVAAIAQDRHPDKDITYLESDNAFRIGDETFELQYEITADRSDYETVCKHVQTLELFFEVE